MVIDQTVINIGTNSGSPTTLYENTDSTDVIINNLLTVSYNDFPTSETEKITASDGAASDRFGTSVSMSSDGNSVIVGANYDDISSNSDQGSAYIYKYNSGTSSWDETKLIASDGGAGDLFGYSVAISGDGNKVIVGAYGDDTLGSNPTPSDSGSAYIYKYNSGTSSWDETKLTASDAAAGDLFGYSVAMSADGNSVVVGAKYVDDNGTNSGSAYIYKYNSGTSSWDETKLTASDAASGDIFGQSVAMSGDGNKVIVGAPEDDDNSQDDSGSAYIYKYNSGTDSWDETKLTASDAAESDYFGYSVSMSGDGNSVVVGAYSDDDNGTESGSAYIYKYNSGTSSWDETKLTASDAAADDNFGISVAMSGGGNKVIVGAYADDNSQYNSGSAYIYKYNSGTWDETKLTASDAAVSDFFGISVAMSGDGNSVIVGAHWDNISSNTNQGSAYIFQSSDNNDITMIKEHANANDYTLINQSY